MVPYLKRAAAAQHEVHRRRSKRLRSVLAVADLVEEGLEVGAQVGPVLGLEGTQAVDLVLQQLAFLVELRQKSILLLLGVGDDRLALGVGLGDDLRALLFAVAHVLVVDALGEGQHRGGRLRILGAGQDRRRGGGGLGRGVVGVGQLGNAALIGLELLLQILVLHLQGVDG